MTIKTRIAPSPTGNLHLGTVRTALYNILLAKSQGGDFYFRLEDTDRERSKEEFTQEIISGFQWLGIHWDAPAGLNHENGMVRQSGRNSDHQKYVEKLIQEKKAYKCYANSEELEAMRAQQKANKEPEGYDNRGRNLNQADIQAYETEGRKWVVRLNLGANRDIQWKDIVRGDMSINTKDLGGDPVIQKHNGQILYNFGVVIDDYEMSITHVFRGEDHLTNTAKQIVIYEALGFPIPVFGHLPLIFTKDKQKLSKRKHGDIAGVEKYRQEGYLPAALINYLVGMSYTCPQDQEREIYSLEEAIKDFSTAGLSKSPAIYDLQKLNWYNREYIAKLSHQELMSYLKPFLKYDLSKFPDADQITLIDAVRGNLNKFEDINENISYFFEDFTLDDKLKASLEQSQSVIEELKNILSNDSIDFSNALILKEVINEIGTKLNLSGKNLFWPIRIALSGRTHGPDLGCVIYLLGRDLSVKRLEAAQKIFA